MTAMNEKEIKPTWYKQLAQPPLVKPHWNEEKMYKLNGALRQGTGSKSNPSRFVKYAASTIMMCMIIAALAWLRSSSNDILESRDWSVRHAFSTDEYVQWEVLPGGEQTAGIPIGAIWMLYKPFDELIGHKIEIVATHRQTGMQLIELPEIMIEESDRSAYELVSDIDGTNGTSKMTRLTSELALPLDGDWRFEMLLDDAAYGDAVVHLTDSDWELSGTFESGVYTMTGINSKLGIINPGFVAGKPNKYLWHFWGSDEQLKGDLIVYGIKQSSDELVPLFKGKVQPYPINGADASHPSGMTLPAAGKWKLIAVINDRWFESIVVQADK